jgi:hypothetical protein
MTDTAQPITRPPWNLQTIFADNIVNLARGSGVVKFYLERFDPPMSGNAQPDSVPVCQVIMPIRTFAAMTQFQRTLVRGSRQFWGDMKEMLSIFQIRAVNPLKI